MAQARSKSRQWLRGEERRRQLLDVAIRVAARRGLGRTAHAEIAQDAGVAVSSVFAYFPNRSELMAAVVADVGEFYIALARRHHERAADPLAAVRSHFLGFAESVETHPDYAQVWLEWAVLIRCEDGLWDAFLEFQEQIISIVARSIRKCQKSNVVPASVTAPESARLLVASAYTTVQLVFMKRSKQVIRRYTEKALELALHL
ncbi:MAG: TetR/AcrR family transcriptional regulator [Gammaproteobacteria bacterium]